MASVGNHAHRNAGANKQRIAAHFERLQLRDAANIDQGVNGGLASLLKFQQQIGSAGDRAGWA